MDEGILAPCQLLVRSSRLGSVKLIMIVRRFRDLYYITVSEND